ncbi:MAG: CocE/NonD family hydrolase [Patulibacter sp.]
MRLLRPALAAAAAAATLATTASPASAAWQPDQWTLPTATYGISKVRNQQIQLADGRTLRGDVYTPADPATGKPAAGSFPVVLGMTPFGKTQSQTKGGTPGANGLNLELVRRGYIAAVVDIPGTGGSEGRFDLFDRAEAIAERQVVTWASKLPGSSGSVGMLGLSYTAIDQLFTAAEVGPGSPLKAIFPMAASVDPYRDLFVSGGALNVMSPIGLLFGYGGSRAITPYVELSNNLAEAFRLSRANVKQLNRFEARFFGDMLRNGPVRYYGDYWIQRTPQRILQQIVDNGVAVYLAGGAYDVFQRGEPLLYSGLQNAAAGRPVTAPMLAGQAASGRYQLLTGPWNHGSIGDGTNLSAIQLAWFDRWLKGVDNGIDQTTTPLHVQEPGGTTYDTATYPLTEAAVNRLYLKPAGQLDGAAPQTPAISGDQIVDTLGLGNICSRSTEEFSAGALVSLMQGLGCWPTQRKPASGAGETTYSTPPLEHDLQLAGPASLTLYAGSTTRDALFAVTIEDVAPSGRSDDITGGDQLGSLRAVDEQRSWSDGAGGWIMPDHPYTPASRRTIPRGLGTATRFDIELRPAFATIPAGHRLRVRISTSDLPHIIPLKDLVNIAGGTRLIRHDAQAASYVSLSVR